MEVIAWNLINSCIYRILHLLNRDYTHTKLLSIWWPTIYDINYLKCIWSRLRTFTTLCLYAHHKLNCCHVQFISRNKYINYTLIGDNTLFKYINCIGFFQVVYTESFGCLQLMPFGEVRKNLDLSNKGNDSFHRNKFV